MAFPKELHQQHVELLDRLGELQAEAMTSHDEEAISHWENGIWNKKLQETNNINN